MSDNNNENKGPPLTSTNISHTNTIQYAHSHGHGHGDTKTPIVNVTTNHQSTTISPTIRPTSSSSVSPVTFIDEKTTLPSHPSRTHGHAHAAHRPHHISGDEKKQRTPRPRLVRTLRPFYRWQWLDVRDPENTWLEAQVIEVNDRDGDQIKVHYKGWAAKYDEWLNGHPDHPNAARIALFGKHTSRLKRGGGEVKVSLGLRVDVRDTLDEWIHGTVVAMDDIHDMVRIHYEGWDIKFDEWMNAESDRLAPAYSITRAPPGVIVPHPLLQQSQPIAMTTPPPPSSSQPPLPIVMARSASADRPDRKSLASLENENNFKMTLMKERGFTIVDVSSDGNCLFRAVSHQVYGDSESHALIRARCMAYIEAEQWYFQSFIAEPFLDYVTRLKNDGEWGDHVEIMAMCKIYNRPIEIYAYRTQPLVRHQPKNNVASSVPIRLSYHFQSHYQSVIHESTHMSSCLRSAPGVVEDEAIRRARATGGSEEERASRQSDIEATEMETIRSTMGLSRDEASRAGSAAFDTIVQASLREFTAKFEKDLLEAKQRSEADQAEKEIMAVTIKESEEEILNRVKAASRAEHKAVAPATPSVDDELLRKALADSAADQLKAILQESLLSSNNQWPAPIKRCIAAGYTTEQSEIAYTIYGNARVGDEKITNNMLDWLRVQFGAPLPPPTAAAAMAASRATEFKGQKTSR